MSTTDAGQSRWGLSLPWWSLALGSLATVWLAGLAFVVLVLHVFTFGFSYALDLGVVDSPDVAQYELALAVGIGINVFGALALSRLALGTRAATWPPLLAAVPIALFTGVTATAGMLATLGIGPLDVVPFR